VSRDPLTPIELAPADVARVKQLYLAGQYRAAYELGETFGPLRRWDGPSARLIGGRLAIQLGAPRLGRQLHLLTFRQSPAHLEGVYYHARYKMERFGPLSCWRFQRLHTTDWGDAPPELRADWCALQGFTAARVRDFDRAEKFLEQSEALSPNRPWHYVERSSTLELQDKLDDALSSARRSLEIQPWFRPGIQATAHLLVRLGRETEAVDLLTDAMGHLESGMVAAQLAALHLDARRPADALRCVERFVELSPLMEPDVVKWVDARRADATYLLGDPTAAAAHARAVGDDRFYATFAENLHAAAGRGESFPQRFVLPVEIGEPTAAPDVFRLMASAFGCPVPTPAPDAPPPMDGIPDAAERKRFDDAGWITREFTLRLPAAVSLIGAGVPFLVTLVEAGFGQPRLVIGVDPLRESLFLADGMDRKPAEAPLHAAFERFGSTGPRCLVAVPPELGAKLTGLELPDADAHDRLHRAQLRLAERRFADAKAAFAELTAADPGHRLAKVGALAWARATQHPIFLLNAAAALLADFPHDATYAMVKANALRELGRVHERLDFLRAEGGHEDADPIVMQTLAQALLPDPRAVAEADQLLRRSLRIRPHAAPGYFLLAAHHWERGHFAESVELHRAACCLDDREEQFAEAYLRVARASDQLSEAVKMFQRRAKAAVPSAAAVRSLHAALLERGEPDFARTALDKAVEKLASDNNEEAARALSDLRLFRAEALAGDGRFDAAEAELAAAEPITPRGVWLKAATRVARIRPDFRTALARLRDLLATDPLNSDARRLEVGLIADVAGKPAAVAHLADLRTRFPDHYPTLRLRAEFLAGEADESPILAARELVELCPADGWAHRQLALILADRKRHAEALAAVTAAGECEPNHPSYFAVLANVHRRADRTDEALDAFRAGLTRHIDHELAVGELVKTARGVKEKQAALQFILDQLRAQVTTGEGLLAYRDSALAMMDDPEDQERLYAELDAFLDERPDLWQAWSLMTQQLLMMQRSEEAAALGREACDRFPLLSRLWLDLAEAYRQLDRDDDRQHALRQAIACAPGWTAPVKELSDALADAKEYDDALAVLEANAARSPLDPLAHGYLAERLWDNGRSEEALAHAEQAVRHEPGYDWAWGAVANWGDRLEKPDAVVQLARDMAADRAGDPRAFMKLARSLYRYDQTPEALAALDAAIALDPRSPEPHDLKAERLADVGRYEEALAAAHPPALADDLPLILQGRAAWVDARRGNYAAAIPTMQALVSVDPEYYWGWQQLADWYNDTGKGEAYLEAAGELCNLRPGHPVPLTLRGDAKLQTGDREGGKGDLRDALRIHPGYSPAAAILFDACLADDELKDARAALAVLLEHQAGPDVLIKQIVYCARTADGDGAARAFGEVCLAPGEGSPALLQLSLAEMKAAGWEDKAAALMEDAWRSGEPFNPWAGLFWLDTLAADHADADDRVAACTAVIREYPTFLPGHDRHAEQLARLGRFDDARGACAPAELVPPPLTLRGRAAWVTGQQGDKAAAVTEMSECLDEDPDYAWGWRQMVHWCDDLGRHREWLAAAEQLVRLSPGDAYSFAVRGEAKRVLGDHRGAKDDYQRAFELDPNFDAAGHQLISEQMATDDLGGASRTLDALRLNSDGPLLRLRAVQLATRQKGLTPAREALRELLADPAGFRILTRDALQAFDERGWAAEAEDELSAALQSPTCPPSTAAAWADRYIAGGNSGRVADQLKPLVERNPAAGREAVLVYAYEMTASGQPDAATATVQRFAELLRETDDSWARAGATLAEAKQYPLAVAWLSDWQQRDGCEGWMLRPLADAHRATGNDPAADALLRAAADHFEDLPADLLAWLAVADALAGNLEASGDHLDELAADPDDRTDGVALLMALAGAVGRVSRAPAATRAAEFAEAKEDLKAAAGACAKADVPRGVARLFQRVVARMVADVGGLSAKFWGWRQKLRPWVTEG